MCKGGWQQYFDFSYITGSTKNATLKTAFTGLKALSSGQKQLIMQFLVA